MKRFNITVNGNAYDVAVEEITGSDAPAAAAAPAKAAAPKAAPAAKASAPAGSTKVSAPMPGTILAVKVDVGATVKKGDAILVLEAMKMENDIPAPIDGKVVAINVKKGDTVSTNDLLASIQ